MNMRGRNTDKIRRRSRCAPKDELLLSVWWLFNIKRYNLHEQAPLKSRAAIEPGSGGDHRRQQILEAGKEERIRIFRGLLQQFFIVPLSQRPLVVCIINKYAHIIEVLLQHHQAMGLGHRRDF